MGEHIFIWNTRQCLYPKIVQNLYQTWEKKKKYKTAQTIFYLQHPEISRPIGESVGSLSVGSLTNVNQTVICDITEEDIETITGTDLWALFVHFFYYIPCV